MKKLSGNRIANAIIIIAIIGVPLLYAGLLTWAYEDPLNRLEKIDAAIVNHDQPYELSLSHIGKPGESKELAVGERLTEHLTEPKPDENVGFAWHSVSDQEAADGLADGRYRAVLELPENLSEHLAQLGGEHPEQASPAVIELRTDDAINYLAGTMAQNVARELESIASGKAAGEFIDTIVVSLASVHTGLSEAAEGASELAQGTTSLADGSDQLAAGAAQLNDGTGQVAAGADQLSSGTRQVSTSSVRLTTGLRELASGAVQLRQGSSALAAGTHQLENGVGRLHAGAQRSADGSQQLASGLDQYLGGVGDLSAGLNQLRAGFTTPAAPNQPSYLDGSAHLAAALSPGDDPTRPTLHDGAANLESGMREFDEGLRTAGDGAEQLASGAKQLHLGADELSAQFFATPDGVSGDHPTLKDGTAALSAGAAQVDTGVQALATATPQLREGADANAEFVRALTALCTAQAADPVCVQLDAGLRAKGIDGFAGLTQAADALQAGAVEAADGVNQLATGSAQLRQGAARLDHQVDQAAPRTHTLAAGAGRLDAGAQDLALSLTGENGTTLRTGYDRLLGGAHQLSTGISDAGAGARSLHDALTGRILPAVTTLAGGSDQLTDSSGKLASGAHQLAEGTAQLAEGTEQMATRVPQLSAGADQLDTGSSQLADASSQAANGAEQLAAGSSQLASGAAELAEGASRAHSGAEELSTGSAQLAEGASRADDGANQLAQELTAGANRIPQYSDTEALAISEVAGHSIEVDALRTHPASHNGIGFAPFFMALALWVGAIAMYFVFPSLDMRAKHAQSWWMRALRPFGVTALLGVGQALAVVAGLQLLLDLDARRLLPLLAVVMLGSLCFVAINQACVATLGFRGRFVSVLLLILQISSMGATFPIETAPRPLQVLSQIFPMTYLAQAIRGYVVGGGLGLGIGIVVIALWTILAWSLTLFAARRRSAGKPMPFDPALAFPGTPAAQATDKLSVASV